MISGNAWNGTNGGFETPVGYGEYAAPGRQANRNEYAKASNVATIPGKLSLGRDVLQLAFM